MPQDYQKLFSYISTQEPSQELLGKIMSRIEGERKMVAIKRKIIVFSVGLAGSILALVPAFKMVWDGISSSGFAQFLSLLFTDSEVVMAYWQSFAMTLLESLPMFSIILFLVIVFTLLGSARFLSKNIKIIHNLRLT
jgi:hypothetical protein